MPEQERFSPKDSFNTPSKGKSMYQAGQSPKFAPTDYSSMDAGEIAMPIGKHKGEKIRDVVKYDLKDFMKIYSNLNKIEASPTQPKNYSGDSLQAIHQKMKEYVAANNLEQKYAELEGSIESQTTPIEKQVGAAAFRVPDGFAENMIGITERGDIRKIGINRINTVLSKLTPMQQSKFSDYVTLLKTYVAQAGREDVGLLGGDSNMIPKGVFMGDGAKYAELQGKPLSEVKNETLADIHRYFNYNLRNEAPNKFQVNKPFYDNLTKRLFDTKTIMEIEGQILYPYDIVFYNQYKTSKPVGSVGEKAYPIDVEIIRKADSRYPQKDTGGNIYFRWLFVEKGTTNVIEYRDYSPPHSKSKDHEGLVFDYEMMKLRSKNAAAIEADIKYHSMTRGVMRTRIEHPIFIEVIEGGGSTSTFSPEDANKQDDNIRRDKEFQEMIPADVSNKIRKGVERDFGDKEQADKLGSLVDKYKGESVKKSSPSLNEHVQKMLKISNYKRIIK